MIELLIDSSASHNFMSIKEWIYLICKVQATALVAVKLANGLAISSIGMCNLKINFSSELVLEIEFQVLECEVC